MTNITKSMLDAAIKESEKKQADKNDLALKELEKKLNQKIEGLIKRIEKLEGENVELKLDNKLCIDDLEEC